MNFSNDWSDHRQMNARISVNVRLLTTPDSSTLRAVSPDNRHIHIIEQVLLFLKRRISVSMHARFKTQIESVDLHANALLLYFLLKLTYMYIYIVG